MAGRTGVPPVSRGTGVPPVWRARLIIALAFAAGAAGSVWFASSPQMCASCHHTRPYVHNWRASGHRSVHCLRCHSPIAKSRSILRTGLESLKLAKEFATEKAKHEELSDQNLCLREGCHSTRLGEQEIEDACFAFDHDKHLSEERDTVELHCSSCHAKTAHSPPPGPARQSCAICHEAEMGACAPLEKCLECHPHPIGARAGGFDHSPLGAAGNDCALCHGKVLSGGRDVSRDCCSRCHAPAGHIEYFNLPTMVHYATVTERGIACGECHEQPLHRSSRQPVPETIEEAEQGR